MVSVKMANLRYFAHNVCADMGNYGQCNTPNANMADLSAGRPESSCTKARLVRPQEFCSDLAIESINVVHFKLLRA